jgi:hypothetical protein
MALGAVGYPPSTGGAGNGLMQPHLPTPDASSRGRKPKVVAASRRYGRVLLLDADWTTYSRCCSVARQIRVPGVAVFVRFKLS